MATIKINKTKMLKALKRVVSSTLYEVELINQPGLALEDALILSGDPIEFGEEEIDNITEELMVSIEAYISDFEV